MHNEIKRKSARLPEETLWLHYLLHIGFTKSLLSEAKIRKNRREYGRRSINRAADLIKDSRMAFQIHGWPSLPSNKEPGKSIYSLNMLTEFTFLTSAMYYLYKKRVYTGLSIAEVVSAYELYTNIRNIHENKNKQISPSTAFYVARELEMDIVLIPYCHGCNIRYYSSADQHIKNACPFCREVGEGDFDDQKNWMF